MPKQREKFEEELNQNPEVKPAPVEIPQVTQAANASSDVGKLHEVECKVCDIYGPANCPIHAPEYGYKTVFRRPK